MYFTLVLIRVAMAMLQNSNTISVLFLTCHGTKDMDWTRDLICRLRQDGFHNIHVFSTTDSESGFNCFEKLQNVIRKVQKILVVISKTTSRRPIYIHTISCTMEQVLQEELMCDIVPVLLDEDVDMPFLLRCCNPFLLYDDDISKLKRCLFAISEGQAVTQYVRSIIGLSVQENKLRRLNKLALPAGTSDLITRLAKSAMQHWGITVNDKCLTVNMKELQNASAYHRICLNDLFGHFHTDDIITIIRLTGVNQFSFQTLFENGQVYRDLITIYTSIFSAVTKDKQCRYWYQYRRNGLAPADGAELAYKPMNDGLAAFNDGKMHSPEFKTYESRLQSLNQFPIASQKVRELIAEGGFFSLYNLDYIQCFHCGICLRTWNINSSEHSFYFENCAMQKQKLEISEKIRSKEFRDHLIGASLDNIFNRMFTYLLFPNIHEHDVQHLMQFAQAGFYYLGTKEDTLCYSCYLGLTKTKDHQDPWEVHYRFSPNCKHLKALDEKKIRHFEEKRQSYFNAGEFIQYLEIEIMLHK